MKVLFVNEGELGAGVMGHGMLETSLRTGLQAADDVEARFVRLPPMSRASVRSAMSLPWLGPRDLDLQPSRWHAMQSVRARRVVHHALAEEIPDVLHVHSHTVAFLLGGIMRRVPTVLSMDATVWDWHQMAIWSTPPATLERGRCAPSSR